MHLNKQESGFLKIAVFPERRLSSVFVTAGLAIFLAIWTVSPTVAGEKLFEQNTESQQENLRRRIAESEHVLLVCEFKQKWIPPEKNLPKGKLMFSARIIETYKGTLTVGKRISFFYYIAHYTTKFSDSGSLKT